MVDYVGAGLAGLDWWNKRKSSKDATHAQKEGFDQGREDVKGYADPYVQSGLSHMADYNKMGEFDFQFDQDDPSYQWRLEQGLQGVQRTQAGQKMLGSGNTLAALNTRAQNEASQEYQAEFDRDFKTFGTNMDYHARPMELGQDAGKFAGQYLSDMAIGIGAVDAKYQTDTGQIDAKGMGALGELFSSGSNQALNSAVKYGADKMGLSPTDALKWAGEKLGLIQGAGSALTGAGTGLSATGAGSQAAMLAAQTGEFGAAGTAATIDALGGGASATGATSAATAGFGTWAASLAGGAALMVGIKMGVEALRESPRIGNTLEKISQQQDPLGYIRTQVEGGDLLGLTARRGSTGDWSPPTIGGNANKGMLYSTILANTPPEGIAAMQTRPDIGRIVGDMWSATAGGSMPSDKRTGGAVPNPEEGLMKLFPSLADEIRGVGISARGAISSAATATSNMGEGFGTSSNSVSPETRAIYDAAAAKRRTELFNKMNVIMAGWEVESFIELGRDPMNPTSSTKILGG